MLGGVRQKVTGLVSSQAWSWTVAPLVEPSARPLAAEGHRRAFLRDLSLGTGVEVG